MIINHAMAFGILLFLFGIGDKTVFLVAGFLVVILAFLGIITFV